MEPGLPPGIVEVATKYGPMLAFEHDIYITRSLSLYGEWCETELALARQIVPEGGVVIDGGANIGAMTRAFSQMVGPKGHVLAVEFLPATARLLACNTLRGCPGPVEVAVVALSDAPGQVPVPAVRNTAAANYGALNPGMFTEAPPLLRVPCMRIDDLFALPRLDLLKLDVEGAEAAALAGARETLRRLQPAVYLEVLTLAALRGCMEVLRPLGYAAYWHLAPLFNPGNANGVSENVFGGTRCVNLLCVPRARRVTGLTEVDPDLPAERQPVTLRLE